MSAQTFAPSPVTKPMVMLPFLEAKGPVQRRSARWRQHAGPLIEVQGVGESSRCGPDGCVCLLQGDSPRGHQIDGVYGAESMTIRTDKHRLGICVRQPSSDLFSEGRGFGLVTTQSNRPSVQGTLSNPSGVPTPAGRAR